MCGEGRCRDRAAAVLKQEVEEMQRREKRAAVDLTYVKGVLVSGFESNELSVRFPPPLPPPALAACPRHKPATYPLK